MHYHFVNFLFTINGIEGVVPMAYLNRMSASSDHHHVEESCPSSSLTFPQSTWRFPEIVSVGI